MTSRRGSVHVEVLRGGLCESRHEADFAVAGAGEPATLDNGEPVFLRSAAKPFQAAAVVACGAADRFGFSEEEVAIVAASHSGEDRHTAIVAALLAKIGVSESALGCGVHPPFDAPTAARLGAAISPLHHNCSGKHAGMLALARHLGISSSDYLDPDGAVQQTMRRTVAAACGLAPEAVATAIDGCSALTFGVPLGAGARAFALLATPGEGPADLRTALARVAEAMAAHPHLVGGSGRFDTRLMTATAARLLSKAGAEGVQGVADRASGRGLCLKARDGSARVVGPATLEVLRTHGWITPAELGPLADEARPPIVNAAGKLVGEIVAKI